MKKTTLIPEGSILKGKTPELELKFSFKYFDSSDEELCPPKFNENYTQVLMERLKALSSWTVQEFISSNSKSIRSHPHIWEKTSRPNGFSHLNEQLKGTITGWQFQLTLSEHGRVHGFFINNTFYIVWLDKDHKLYPKK